MRLLSKGFCLLFLVLLAASSLIMVKPTFAQSIPKPSVPQFTLQYFDYISNIAPTTSTNPYTGQNVTTSHGSTFYNETVVFTIKNQPFTPYTDSNGKYIGIYYNFRYKGHYEDQWTYLPFNPDGVTGSAWGGMFDRSLPYFSQSGSDYTTFVFALTDFVPYGQPALPVGGQLDFQLQAQIGNISYASEGTQSLGNYYSFTGESSDWSNTQTLTVNYNSNSTASNASLNPTLSPSPEPTSTPSVPEFPMLAILPLFVSVLGGAVLIRHRKPKLKSIDLPTQA